MQPMMVYVVKGPPDACGRGCDSWIEAEGQIDGSTNARLKTTLDRVRDRNLPIYFNSPGGNLDQAVVMGNLLHAKPTTARVGRTLVRECGFEAQDSDVCIKLKQSGRELHGDLFTRGVFCLSACPFVWAGAATHDVAPDAVLGVHSPRVVLSFHGGQPTREMVAAADERGHERADRMVAAYLARVGVDAGLLTLSKSVKFADMHVLTREEIVRLGLDRREFVETPWRLENNGRSMMHKMAVARGPGETSFRTLQWWVICFDANRFALEFQRPVTASSTFTSISVVGSDAKPVYFGYPPVKASGLELWGLRVERPNLRSLMDREQVNFTEMSTAADGRPQSRTIKLSNAGWGAALDALLATCSPAKDAAAPQAAATREGVAK
jgi:hypothetical protein